MKTSQPAPYSLRMDAGLRQILDSQASANNRSLHAEIISILSNAVGFGHDDDRIEQIARRIFHEEVQRMGLTKEVQSQ